MSKAVNNWCHELIYGVFLTYSTVKLVKVPNTYIAILNRILQLIIFAYIVLYIVWYKRGYQEFQEPRGTSVIKVKGIARVSANDALLYTRAASDRLWDTAEYEVPPLENNAFFIATHETVTYNQTERNCPSALDDKLFCNETTKQTVCPKDRPTPNTFGYFTGECVPSLENATETVCEINAWCPEELSLSTDYRIDGEDLKNFTVFLKTLVTYSLFNVNLRNVRDDTKFSCRYNSEKDPHCPIFRIGDILQNLQTNQEALLNEGGLIEIRQDWQCNFDFKKDRCYPKYTFSVLQSGDDIQSPGINYRSAQKYRVGDVDYRTLSKIYGLRFVVSITGKGGRFNIVNLFVAIGSGIGFMVIAGIVCDMIFMYFHKHRMQYRESKLTICHVDGEDPGSSEHLIRP
jgi:P2X purinoceptor 4